MHASALPLLYLLVFTMPVAAYGEPVYRCGTQYSQTPCPGGHAIEDKLSTLHGSTTAASGQSTVYLCQGQGGGQFWSREHCSKHQATIDRMETVTASLPWPQQVQQAQRQWEQSQKLVQTPREKLVERHRAQRQTHRVDTNLAKWEKQQEKQQRQQEQKHSQACSRLQLRITDLDRQGRAGDAPVKMEQLRAARRKASEDARNLGC